MPRVEKDGQDGQLSLGSVKLIHATLVHSPAHVTLLQLFLQYMSSGGLVLLHGQ